MALYALFPLDQTICRLLNSSRISIESPSREILEFAHYGVGLAVQLLASLEDFRESMGSKGMKAALEEMIRDEARELEQMLDSHVFDQFLLQSETEQSIFAGDEINPLLFSLDVQGVRRDIDGFTQMTKKLQRYFNPWFEEEEDDDDRKESDISGYQYRLTRTRFVSWYAAKAASIFSGMEEKYIKDLENLLPEEEDDDDYAVLFTSDFSGSKSEDRYEKIKDGFASWWINKAAASIFDEENEESIKELDNPLPEEEEEEKEDKDAVLMRNEFVPNMSNMVGLTDLFCEIRDLLIEDWCELRVASIVGMAGIGKTALVKKILEDPLILSKFECRIFVKMGPESQFEEIMQAILAQMNPDRDKMLLEGDENLDEYLHNTFNIGKYLIVLDDLWNRNLWNDFLRILPYEVGGNSVLVTTRLEEVAEEVHGINYFVPFLNEEESWDLLRWKIFQEKGCPPELERDGKKIAENCEGLPLLIITVADLLSKAETTLECWSKVAANKTNSIFTDAYEQISEVLYPSYYYLPQHLKTCFLYLGAFPQNCEVRVSKLINLWSAEGFLGAPYQVLEDYVEGYYDKIVSNNIVLDSQRSSIFNTLKACSLHSVFWYLCKREAWNAEFLHVLNSYTDARVEDIESRRRLSIYKNIVLIIKDVRDSIASMSAVRSLLCTGPYHQYQVPICFGSRLLKVFDALTIRFYEFPIEVLKLVHLRYLSLTCNENLPPSISKLWNLQCLIVYQHLSIRSTISQSYLPVEIWDLQELEYLQIMGRNLPDPPHGVVLRNLVILLDVGAHTCTERVVKSIPNLHKLRVRIEFMPDAAEVPLCFYDDISRLEELRSLQCVVVNPELVSETAATAPLVFASFLTKLTLSGFGCSWKDMNKIGELHVLRELKLKCCAFGGEEWTVKETEFRILRYLSIEDSDLVQWTGGDLNFPQLFYLTMKNCYKLQEIPNMSSLYWIRLVDCSPKVLTCAKYKVPCYCTFYVGSSWPDHESFKSLPSTGFKRYEF